MLEGMSEEDIFLTDMEKKHRLNVFQSSGDRVENGGCHAREGSEIIQNGSCGFDE